MSRFGILRTVFVIMALVTAAGCNRGPAPVEGTVQLNGTPLASVQVVFLPDPEQQTRGPRSTAFTDAKGHYRLLGDNQRPGAVVGQHRVLVTDLLAAPAPPPRGPAGGSLEAPSARAGRAGEAVGGPGAGKKSRVPAVYGSASQTPLRKEVKPGAQTIDLELTTRP